MIQSRAGEGLGVMDLRANRLMTIKESKHLEICYNSALIWFLMKGSVQFSLVAQSCLTLCDPMNCSTPGLPVTNSRSSHSLRLMSIESVMPSSHLILCHPLLFLLPIPPSIRVFSILLFSSVSLQWSLRKAFLSLLAIFWHSAFKWVYLSFFPLPFVSLLFTAICKASSDNHFTFLHFFFLGMVLILLPVQCHELPSIVLQVLCLSDLVPWIYFHFQLIILRDLICILPEWSRSFP